MNWKWAGWSAWALLMVLIGLAFYADTSLLNSDTHSHKPVEIQGSFLTGYAEGRKSWTVTAPYIWTDAGLATYHAKPVQSGVIWDSQGKVVIQHLEAEQVTIQPRNKLLFALGNITAQFVKRTQKGAPQSYTVEAAEFRYFHDQKMAYLGKNCRIINGKSIFFPKRNLQANIQNNTLMAADGFFYRDEAQTVSGNQLMIWIDEDLVEVTGGVIAHRKAQKKGSKEWDERERDFRSKPATLTCDGLRSNNQTHFTEAIGSVCVIQKDKVLRALSGSYDEDARVIQCRGNVSFKCGSLYWLLPSTKRHKFENPTFKQSLASSTQLTCETLTLDLKKKEVVLEGKVVVTQPKRVITCSKLTYSDRNQTLTFEGSVVIKNGKDTLETSLLVFSLDTESVVASQRVKTRFKIQTKEPQS